MSENLVPSQEYFSLEILSSGQAWRRALSLSDNPAVRILGITGPPGVGKSTLSAQLAEKLGQAAIVLPMDGFHLSNAVLKCLGRDTRKGAPDTFDVDGFVSLLQRVKTQRDDPVYAPEFSRAIDEAIAGAVCIDPKSALVIVEGNYLLFDGPWSDVRTFCDEIWYVTRNKVAREKQLQKRHVHFGRTVEQAREWVEKVDGPNAVAIEKTRHHANFLIDLDDLK